MLKNIELANEVFKFERKSEMSKKDLKRKLQFIVCKIKLIKIRFIFMNY